MEVRIILAFRCRPARAHQRCNSQIDQNEPHAPEVVFPRVQPRPFNDTIPGVSSADDRADGVTLDTLDNPSNPLSRIFRSALDAFGIYRTYSTQPAQAKPPSESPPSMSPSSQPQLRRKQNILWPYPNFSSFLLGRWFWSGEKKSQEDRAQLLDVLQHPDFKLDDIRGVGFNSIDKKLSDLQTSSSDIPFLPDGWSKRDISIQVPRPKLPHQSFSVPSLHHRSLMTRLESKAPRPDWLCPYRRRCVWVC